MTARSIRGGVAVLAGLLVVTGCSGGDPTAASRSSSPSGSTSGPTAGKTVAPIPGSPGTAPAKKVTPVPKRSTGVRDTSTPQPVAVKKPAVRWVPKRGTRWQWQLSGKLNLNVNVPIYDIDGAGTTAAQVAALHRRGRRAICYVNVGAYENFRSDKSRFRAAVLGKPLDGWAGERWLDIRRIDLLAPIMSARFANCRAKGFDAVEPDNVDGYANNTGFRLTAAHQLRYNRWIAALAHSKGMSVALKNDLGQVRALVPYFDFAVNEQCVEFDECETLLPFIRAGKAVLHVEYGLSKAQFCAKTRVLGFSSMRKPLDLGPAREPC
jgi:hypothetical protein